MNTNCLHDTSEGMKWDVSPFKAKNIPAFVATPSNKWSSSIKNEEGDVFRGRLHSSPYLGDENLKRPRLCHGSDQATFSSTCSNENKHVPLHSLSWSSKLIDETDSGIVLQQTHFYDTISPTYNDSDSRLFLTQSDSCEAKETAGLQGNGVPVKVHEQVNVRKYSFDPLATPFKPKTMSAPDIPYRRSDVRAIDVAKSISSAYAKDLYRFGKATTLRDITNIPLNNAAESPRNVENIASKSVRIPPLTSEQTSDPLGGRWKLTLGSNSKMPNMINRRGILYGNTNNLLPSDGSLNKKIVNDVSTASVTVIENQQLANPWREDEKSLAAHSFVCSEPVFPFSNGNVHDSLYRLFDVGDMRGGSDVEPMQSGWMRDYVQNAEMKRPMAKTPKDQVETSGREAKKVTFADIVRAGIEAINLRKVEIQRREKAAADVFTNTAEPSVVGNRTTEILDLSADEGQSYKPSKYRTEPCTTFHTIGVCPYGGRCNFYHELNEKNDVPTASKATRYKTRLCKTWQRAGECSYGVKCDFAHGTNDLASNAHFRPHYKTRMCQVLQQTGRCPYGAQCTFAHKNGELRTDISLIYKYKTKICKSWALGLECSHGSDCHFAHGDNELKMTTGRFENL